MNDKSSFLFILFIIILINTGGFILNYFEYGTYFIVLGFRFHLSLLVPFLLLLRSENFFLIKEKLLNPGFKGKLIPLLWILTPLIAVSILLFTGSLIIEGDPEYFYEFGLSSILDYPVYLLWNFPQLILFYLFLSLALNGRKYKFISALFLIFFLFAFEFINPGTKSGPVIDYNSLAALLISAAICSALLTFYENIYLFSVSVFSVFWIYFLAFGSNSPLIINLLYAAKYKSWEGFFIADKEIADYLIYFYLLLIFIIICAVLPFRGNRKPKIAADKTANIPQITSIG